MLFHNRYRSDAAFLPGEQSQLAMISGFLSSQEDKWLVGQFKEIMTVLIELRFLSTRIRYT